MHTILAAIVMALHAGCGQCMFVAPIHLPAGQRNLHVFVDQRPEDAIDDFILHNSDIIKKDSVASIAAAVTPYICEELGKMQATSTENFVACDSASPNEIVATLNVQDLGLPISNIIYRSKYSVNFYADMLCSLAGPACTTQVKSYLKLRLFSDYVQMTSSSPQNELFRRFVHAATETGDTFEHLHTLEFYATQCESILELGVWNPVSTFGFLYGLLHNYKDIKKLRSVDTIRMPSLDPVYRIAKENNIEFSYEILNDLKLDNLEPVDMTFIDTWHVYGQLKRELQKFAPYTKKWIIMHDTVVDGMLGESVREKFHNITQEHLSTGFPGIEIIKGLMSAIKEFIAANPDWAVDVVRQGNNGLVILKRVSGEPWKAPIAPFVLEQPLSTVSTVDMFVVTTGDGTEKIPMLDTVKYIRSSYPDAIVVLLDILGNAGEVPGVDVTYGYPEGTPRTQDWNTAETTILKSFYESHLFSVLYPFAREMHRISASSMLQ